MPDTSPLLNLTLINLAAQFARNAYHGENTFKGGKMLLKSSKAGVFKPGYYIYEVNNTLFITIRGSSSVADWDANLDYKEIHAEFGKYKVNVHRGFYRAAESIYNEIKPVFLNYNGNFVVCGHSLGASAATLLTFRALTDPDLKKKYNRIRCYAFAPAPTTSMMPKEIQNKILSFVYNNDIVPNLSIASLHRMIKQFVPGGKMKPFFLKFGIRSALKSFSKKKNPFSRNMYKVLDRSISFLVRDIIKYDKKQSKLTVTKLLGNIVHLDGKATTLKDALIKPGKVFGELAPSSVTDHYPHKYVRALRALTA
ncbi:Lipase family protein [Trichomonas vaginalis G3]|uniref:sn-1-specific diacylglycerol lipase n=1 Tax=Trichomonas vaginalis (strain ATCC PRA-98 / G3) TaxID=412133 RepID=A2FY73_TRIV3|nr:lipase [Trichomonas vaginalis G3]EAX90140.1 Lipase family protein [Trichomonas vaginalis G3]KAI5496081.1 retrograde trans-synaptic signaling by lipid [Trichomonas vaginalis G3]|eukprot:XP_001303070.1 lipase [Trichomonas vaginalis G3]